MELSNRIKVILASVAMFAISVLVLGLLPIPYVAEVIFMILAYGSFISFFANFLAMVYDAIY